jgi:hypothetical protein
MLRGKRATYIADIEPPWNSRTKLTRTPCLDLVPRLPT